MKLPVEGDRHETFTLKFVFLIIAAAGFMALPVLANKGHGTAGMRLLPMFMQPMQLSEHIARHMRPAIQPWPVASTILFGRSGNHGHEGPAVRSSDIARQGWISACLVARHTFQLPLEVIGYVPLLFGDSELGCQVSLGSDKYTVLISFVLMRLKALLHEIISGT